jgi:hypothetical protein
MLNAKFVGTFVLCLHAESHMYVNSGSYTYQAQS